MVTELRTSTDQSRQLYVQALSALWRRETRTDDPSIWLARDPEIEEKMLADPDIGHAINYRRHLVAGRQWQVQPDPDVGDEGDLAVEVTTGLLRKIGRFTEARHKLARAFFSGSRFARIHGETKTLKLGDGKPRTWWVPTKLEDIDKRRFRIVPRNPGTENLTAAWEMWDVGTSTWKTVSSEQWCHTIRHVYQDEENSLGYGRGLRDALGIVWYAKENVLQESLTAAERFGGGILTAKIDGARDAVTNRPNSAVVREWIQVLQDMRSRHVLVHDKQDEIEFVNSDANGWQLLQTLREELRTQAFTIVLAANITQSANKGGSYALSEVQENSTEALIQFDRESMEETLTRDLIGCLWWRNWANMLELGIQDQKPRFSINQEKLLDPQQRAQAAQVLHAMGVALAADDLYEQTGFRRPRPNEDVIQAPQMPAMPDPFAGATDLPPMDRANGAPPQ